MKPDTIHSLNGDDNESNFDCLPSLKPAEDDFSKKETVS